MRTAGNGKQNPGADIVLHRGKRMPYRGKTRWLMYYLSLYSPKMLSGHILCIHFLLGIARFAHFISRGYHFKTAKRQFNS